MCPLVLFSFAMQIGKETENRCQLGNWDAEAGNMEQAVKHWTMLQHLVGVIAPCKK